MGREGSEKKGWKSYHVAQGDKHVDSFLIKGSSIQQKPWEV